MPSLLAPFLKRSTPSIFLKREIHCHILTFSRQLSSESNVFKDSRNGFPLGMFLRSISGVFISSCIGFCIFSSASTDSSVSFADYCTPTHQSQEPQKKTIYLFGDSYRRRIFFNYEKRIRMRSRPEKVFEYFASVETPEGEILMTPMDFMRAVIPVFPPSESNLVREGYLRGERRPGDLRCPPSSFFMLFDTDNNGLISFPEYIFFVTLHSIPETSFSAVFKMFDHNHNGAIDCEEFKKMMTLMRSHNRQWASHMHGRYDEWRIGKSVGNGGLVEYFFGKERNGNLQHEQFLKFLSDLHEEILQLEFAHYDYKSRGTISAKDFALSMVASADLNHINRLLDRVDELNNDPHLRDMRITFKEFRAFEDLRRRLKTFALAIFAFGEVNGLLTKKEFQRAAFHVCGVSLTENVVDVIFFVFDINRDGSISLEEFLRVLEKRGKDIGHPTGTGLAGRSCAKTCSFMQRLQ